MVMQCFWFVPTGDLWRVDYQRQEEQPEDAIPNGTPEVTAMDGTQSHSPLDCIQAILFCSVCSTWPGKMSLRCQFDCMPWLRVLTANSLTFVRVLHHHLAWPPHK